MTTVRSNGRIRIRELQKMLGLQIWISTVFRVLRQFLTSTCEVLRISKTRSFFYPRKHQDLVRRLVFDLKWWRRILTEMPRASFAYVLGRLPMNVNWLSSDASGTFGMAGVLHFGRVPSQHKGLQVCFGRSSGGRGQQSHQKRSTMEKAASTLTQRSFWLH